MPVSPERLSDVDEQLAALGKSGDDLAEVVAAVLAAHDGNLEVVDAALEELAADVAGLDAILADVAARAPTFAAVAPAAAPEGEPAEAPAAEGDEAPAEAAVPEGTPAEAAAPEEAPAQAAAPEESPTEESPTVDDADDGGTDELSLDGLDDLEDDSPQAGELDAAALFGDLGASAAPGPPADGLGDVLASEEVALDSVEQPTDDLPSGTTALFSASDVAAIRKASEPPPPRPRSEPPPIPGSQPAPASAAAAAAAAEGLEDLFSEEELADDDFELMIDEDTFIGDADEVEGALEANTTGTEVDGPALDPEAAPAEGEPDGSDDDDEKKGFFKKLFG